MKEYFRPAANVRGRTQYKCTCVALIGYPPRRILCSLQFVASLTPYTVANSLCCWSLCKICSASSCTF